MPAGPPAGSVGWDVPVDLSRQQAQRLAELELADPAYRAGQPGLIERGVQWVLDWVLRFAETAGDAAPGGWLGILGLVVLVVVAVLFVRWRVGPVRRTGSLPFTVDPATTAAQYRARAEDLAARGDWSEAISHRMRALVRSCQERGLVAGHPGWTADEVAASLADFRSVDEAAVQQAAQTFDEVRYGGRPGTRAGYDAIASVDDRLLGTHGLVRDGAGTP